MISFKFVKDDPASEFQWQANWNLPYKSESGVST
jgi:hypothetical protein